MYLQFSSSNKKPNNRNGNNANTNVQLLSHRNLVSRVHNNNQPPHITGQEAQSTNPNNSNISEKPRNNMKWGQPTWFLLHTLAEKVKDEHFNLLRKDLLDVIFKICNNLPCPDCANHATRYMQSVNIENIRNKHHLKQMLFTFHNSVNAKKNYPIFQFDELTPKYSKAITVNILTNFMQHFEQSYSSRVNPNNFHRSRTVTVLKKWFSENVQYFDN